MGHLNACMTMRKIFLGIPHMVVKQKPTTKKEGTTSIKEAFPNFLLTFKASLLYNISSQGCDPYIGYPKGG